MKTFSQRKGLKPVVELIQVDGMNDELRTSLWNALDLALWSSEEYLASNRGLPSIVGFSKALWFGYFKKPIDARPAYTGQILKEIRDYFFNCRWFEAYDFLEFTIDYHQRYPRLVSLLNDVLQRELSAYRLVSGHFTDITDTQELEMLETALADSRFAAVTAHLQQALDLYSRRENPTIATPSRSPSRPSKQWRALWPEIKRLRWGMP